RDRPGPGPGHTLCRAASADGGRADPGPRLCLSARGRHPRCGRVAVGGGHRQLLRNGCPGRYRGGQLMNGRSALRRVVRVTGRGQGAGFRMAAAREAGRLGVSGTIRNLLDGAVEADIEGPVEPVEEMLVWLRTGPSRSRVERADVQEADPRRAEGFRVVCAPPGGVPDGPGAWSRGALGGRFSGRAP